jgi:NADPH2:quinone reductase
MFRSHKGGDRHAVRDSVPRIVTARDRQTGETVLVHGASGAVGTAAVQLARADGLRVFGTAGSEQGLKLAREQGAHEVFDHRAPEHFEQIRKATGGAGLT